MANTQFKHLIKNIFNFVNKDIDDDYKGSEDLLESIYLIFKDMTESEIKQALCEFAKSCENTFHTDREIALAVNKKKHMEIITADMVEKFRVENISEFKSKTNRDYAFRLGGEFLVIHDKGKEYDLEIIVSEEK